jgi:2-iminoacetate synthase
MAEYARDMDLRHPESVNKLHEAAQDQGIFSEAEMVRKYYFGHDIHTYGVVYMSDACMEACAFCPAGEWNRNFKPRTMSVEETVADVLCTLLQGHSKVCILQANWRETAFMKQLERWLPEVIRICEPCGLKEIILNVQTLSEESYRRVMELRDAVNPDFTIQVRTFQETYLREWYEKSIPQTKTGNKHDFECRIKTQEIAWKAGVDAVGCGVLFGLSPNPLRELVALVEHAEELLSKGVNVARICLPSAHEISELSTQIPFDRQVTDHSYVECSELVYALGRLALPEMNWVMSERDPASVRDSIIRFASETTVGVRPGVGDNLAAYREEKKSLHFVQATVYRENPAEYVERMARKGYNVVLDLSEKRKRAVIEKLNSMGF